MLCGSGSKDNGQQQLQEPPPSPDSVVQPEIVRHENGHKDNGQQVNVQADNMQHKQPDVDRKELKNEISVKK